MSGVAADSPIAPRECFAIVIATLRVKPAIILSLLCISQAGRADPFAELAPLVHQHCTKCHGGAKQNGGLDLRSLRSLLRGGESGPVFHPGKPEESRLVTQLHPDADPHMPPKGQLSDEEITRIRDWVVRFNPETIEDPGSGSAKPPASPSLPAGLSPSLAIDSLLEKSWQEQNITPAPPVDDAAFLRRLSLDLLGRIPTGAEHQRFLAETRPDKREHLIDELLASKGHARHFAEVFNAALLGRALGKGKNRDDREKHFLPYLRWAIETNRPWNKVGHDLIVARPEQPEARGAAWFLYEQRDDSGKMANATSAALFGKQVQCAQCHDHPVAPEIEQKHYWGLVAFFDRTRNVSTSDGPGLGERAAGGYNKFANLEGESSESELVFLTGSVVEEPGGRREKDDPELYQVAPPSDWINPPRQKKKGEKPKITTKVERAPVPKFSRRAELARLAIEENPAFARAIVNRVWAILTGRGIVHPVDKMTSAHPPSQPELLAWLAHDFATQGYNVRRLCRAILLSRAYGLSNIHPADPPPLPGTFARALDKPLPAEPLYRSILVALGSQANPDGTVSEEETYRESFVSTFPEIFTEVFSPSVQQAMFAANGEVLDSMLRSDKLALPLQLAQNTDTGDLVGKIFLAVLGRDPDTEERQRTTTYIEHRDNHRADAIRQVLWALFNSAEFRINH